MDATRRAEIEADTNTFVNIILSSSLIFRLGSVYKCADAGLSVQEEEDNDDFEEDKHISPVSFE